MLENTCWQYTNYYQQILCKMTDKTVIMKQFDVVPVFLCSFHGYQG